jgi:hypothetical protein
MANTDTCGTSESEQLRQQLAAERREKAELLIENGRLLGRADAGQGHMRFLRGEVAERDTRLAASADVLKRFCLDPLDVRVPLWPTGHGPRYGVLAPVPPANTPVISSSDMPGRIPGGNCEMNSRRLFQGSTT